MGVIKCPHTNLAVLHDVELTQPCLIKRVASSVDDVTQPILLRQHQHRVQKAFHRLCRLNESRPRQCKSVVISSLNGFHKSQFGTHNLCASSKKMTFHNFDEQINYMIWRLAQK